MTFKDELADKVHEFACDLWGEIPTGYSVPEPEDLTFGNTGRRLAACIFYADICASTAMVDTLSDDRAAEYYKAFLHCAAKIIKRNDGVITAYDGDRVMAVFLGKSKEDHAVVAALELNYAVHEIINPKFSAVYKTQHRELRHTVGIDASTVLASKTGVRVDSDLVWVGSAANYASKLNSFDGLDTDYPTRVTGDVYAALSQNCLLGDRSESMWQGPYNNFDPKSHYRTLYRRVIN